MKRLCEVLPDVGVTGTAYRRQIFRSGHFSDRSAWQMYWFAGKLAVQKTAQRRAIRVRLSSLAPTIDRAFFAQMIQGQGRTTCVIGLRRPCQGHRLQAVRQCRR